MHMLSFLTTAAALAATVAAQVQQNSNLPRRDLMLSVTPGVINSTLTGTPPSNLDAGFHMFGTAAPKQFLPERTGGLVATPRLAYAIYADLIGGNIVLQFVRSTDGGRNFGAPQTVYTCNTAGGETLETVNGNSTGGSEIGIYCHGDAVYIAFLTDDLATPTAVSGSQRAYVLGSDDQGQTWSAPLLVSTQIGTTQFDVDEVRGAAAITGLHLVFEWDDIANPGGNENFSYARVGFVGGVLTSLVTDTPITNFPIGGADVDSPHVAADGEVVHICWNDNSDPVLGSTRDNTFSVTSFDAGLTFSVPFDHTGFLVPSTWATARAPECFVDGDRAYTFMEDSRADQDDVWMDRADLDRQNHTVTWTVQGIMCNDTPPGPYGGVPQQDVDGKQVAVENGVIAVLYRDDRQVAANSNYAYVAVDQHGGDDFIANTATHHQLTAMTATIYDVDVTGNMIAAVWEQCSGDEEGAIALSSDRGQSFTTSQYTTLGDCGGTANIDIDDIDLALTQNGDYLVIYADERLGNANAWNAVFLTGGKHPFLVDDTLTNGTLSMHGIDPALASNSIAFLMVSAGGPLPGYNLLGNDYGAFIGLQPDVLHAIMLSNAGATFQPVSATGDVLFAIPGFPIPNLSQLLGLPIDIAAATFSLAPLHIGSFTDPLRM